MIDLFSLQILKKAPFNKIKILFEHTSHLLFSIVFKSSWFKVAKTVHENNQNTIKNI